ncbi:class I SAM-dependent methyltransferase [Ornithinimicrobium tianjinense]|uniref:16S RNA G1207 methylase RsmC n=1 Tax=Ornithinimicrobium tianjinense TaxID=1195761 RepID=A0A917BGB5_9MICO|nr:methyltransferase [Ornithinimicrobium tianjinense]GGF43301.1 16S RNA G1207 methylase RsmC [Ornithinimicrobium tianjinense]
MTTQPPDPSTQPPDHYFTARPASDGELRHVPVRLAGRDVEIVTAGGIFSPDGIDKGTRVLLDEVPPPPGSGTFLDLGCGWGPLALTMALRSPAAVVHAVDVNERALDLCRRNAQALGATGVVATTPDGVDPGTSFDLIWSNPPIRVGKAVLHELMTTWLPRLTPGGTAYLVVQKNLGSDSLQAWLTRTLPDRMGPVEVSRSASSKGFRVLRVQRPGANP